VKAQFTTVQTPGASTLEGQGGGAVRIPPRAPLRRHTRLTLTFSYAPHIFVSVTPGWLARWTRT
jgi:hypothetical protein